MRPPLQIVREEDLSQTRRVPDESIELCTCDLTDLLEEVDDEDIVVEIELEDDLDPPTEDIEDFLLGEEPAQEPERSPDESQKRPRVRRSWIAMPPGNTNARGVLEVEEPTQLYRPRPAMISLPRFPVLPPPPKPKALSPLPSFPLLPAEPRPIRPKAPAVRLPRFH